MLLQKLGVLSVETLQLSAPLGIALAAKDALLEILTLARVAHRQQMMDTEVKRNGHPGST